jgi:uncharacterized protein (TIGR00369 family)
VLEEAVRGVPAAPSYYAVSGREQAQAWQRGDLPATPLARLVGYNPTQVGSGSATLRLPASPWLQYAEGTVDLKILMDEAMQVAVLTGAPPATRVVTASMSIHHLRPSTVESESFVAPARVLNSGSAFTTAEAVVEDALGRAVAHVTGAYVLRELDPAPGPGPNGGFRTYDEPTYATPDPHLRPSPPAVPLGSMSMVDGARGMAAGEVEVPINRFLGVRLLEFGSDGAGMLALPASPWLCSLWTDVQPGVIAAMMHMGLGIAPVAHTSADEYIGIVSQELTFLTAVPADGRELTAPFKLVHEGDLLVSSIEVLDADGNRVAMGSQTSVLRERRRRTRAPAAERILATVLFTDIVGSTERAQELGDERWRELLTEHRTSCAGSSRPSGAERSRPPATGSSRRSTPRHGPCSARGRSVMPYALWGSRSAPASTRASASASDRTSRASRSTPRPASRPRPAPARSSSRAPCATSSRDRASRSPTAACTISRV